MMKSLNVISDTHSLLDMHIFYHFLKDVYFLLDVHADIDL